MSQTKENPAGLGGASKMHRHGDTGSRYYNTPLPPIAQSSNTILLLAIEALAGPGTADIRHGLAALLERPNNG